jgi:hypothetical protein
MAQRRCRASLEMRILHSATIPWARDCANVAGWCTWPAGIRGPTVPRGTTFDLHPRRAEAVRVQGGASLVFAPLVKLLNIVAHFGYRREPAPQFPSSHKLSRFSVCPAVGVPATGRDAEAPSTAAARPVAGRGAASGCCCLSGAARQLAANSSGVR